MKIVFMGTPDFSVGALEALIAAGHELAAVVTQPDKPKGRGHALQTTPVKDAALAHGLPVWQPKKVRDPAFLEDLKQVQPDAVVVVAFGRIIPQAVLELPKYGCINVHASLLPKYRGAAPIQWAVIEGEAVSGVTIMRMDQGLDTGDMLSRVEVPLAEDETGGSLFDKLSQAGAEQLVKTLADLEAGRIQPQKQPAESPTDYARMIQKADGRIDWTRDALSLERLIRGLNPWPSAFTYLKGKTLKIWKAALVPSAQGEDSPQGKSSSQEKSPCRQETLSLQESPAHRPGEILSADKEGLVIQTGKGALEILELQLEGKKRMEAEAFLRGYALEVGSLLGE